MVISMWKSRKRGGKTSRQNAWRIEMHALTYHGSYDVRVETVPDPILQEPDDVILKISATAICGSDLHLYRGKMPELKEGYRVRSNTKGMNSGEIPMPESSIRISRKEACSSTI